MKYILSLVAVFTITSVSGQVLLNKKDSVSYALGAMIVRTMQQQGIEDVNTNLISQAITDALQGKDVLLYPDEAQLCLNNYVREIRAKKEEANKIAGEKFLMENAKDPDVVVLPSGLQYKVIVEGDGPVPVASDKVKTHYHGTLIDGTVFDSSVDRNEPISFNVTGVIKGWQEALQLMKVGSKWQLFVPEGLAYGQRARSDVIGPYSTLIFEIELLDIETNE
ncbi:MAG: FKBP-type peptidyl-prolyl cis-trans isomerase [Saprospiraceae bacterium]|nr:FKBP-type peptidyl-prolyl cis-trans isomerase [Saprospiraceae bacterium]